MTHRSDEELLAAVPGDASALAELYDRHVHRMLGFALRRLDNPEDVVDLVADVFAEVLASAPRFEPGKGGALPWLYGIAGNLVASRRRSGARRIGATARLQGQRPLQPDEYERLEEHLDAAAQQRRLAAAIRVLPDGQRRVLELVALDGLTPSEAAAALGIAPVTARARLSRARRRLRAELTGPPPAPLPTANPTKV